jgi:hypothetical protein
MSVFTVLQASRTTSLPISHPPSRPLILLTSECRTTELCTCRKVNYCQYFKLLLLPSRRQISVTKLGRVHVMLQNSLPRKAALFSFKPCGLPESCCSSGTSSEHLRVGREGSVIVKIHHPKTGSCGAGLSFKICILPTRCIYIVCIDCKTGTDIVPVQY